VLSIESEVSPVYLYALDVEPPADASVRIDDQSTQKVQSDQPTSHT
jgi:hypothetical protein